jgi:ABC-type xylose transport system permease subunit
MAKYLVQSTSPKVRMYHRDVMTFVSLLLIYMAFVISARNYFLRPKNLTWRGSGLKERAGFHLAFGEAF